jgi:hypothetical protein
MNKVRRSDQADRRRDNAARIALGWVVVFVGLHIYWYFGGSFASPGTLPGEPHSLFGWVFEVFVVGAFVLGFLVPMAISRGMAGGRLAKPVAILVWLGAVLLVLRGSLGVIDALSRATGLLPNGITGLSTEQTTGTTQLTWSGWAIETYFLVGGMIFGWLALRHRQSRKSDVRRAHSR